LGDGIKEDEHTEIQNHGLSLDLCQKPIFRKKSNVLLAKNSNSLGKFPTDFFNALEADNPSYGDFEPFRRYHQRER
jgi:hypothetical protein